VVGLGYEAPNQRWGVEGIVTLASGKDPADIDAENPRPATDGYGLVDVLAYYRFGERVTVNAGLFNVTDRRYVRWVDTNGIGLMPDGSPAGALGRFSQPGFNYGLNLRVEL
jgi:hemoglobin/transferrin/lactoferrin receptor protein